MIELLAILVILAMIGAMGIPRSSNQHVKSDDYKPEHSVGTVKTAHATAIAELKRFPTVDELSGYVEGPKSSASASGVQVSINGAQYTVPTYSDSGCRTNTKAIADTVACVGNL